MMSIFTRQEPGDSPRPITRFLCGLSGPIFSKAKLGNDPLFGILTAYRFKEVEELVSSALDLD
jgi:hypothetical protein